MGRGGLGTVKAMEKKSEKTELIKIKGKTYILP